ncbi:MAG: UDP-N-acetylmuramoyl-L-alanine--D-glutamate ligase [Kouleothrix sp.]
MGLGVHGGGLGVARFLADRGALVTVTDLRGPELLQPSLDALAGLPIRFVLGRHDESDFRAADLVVRNPGVPRESRFLQIARAAGATIEMEMTLFFRLCPGPILGITGTKGKTTTTLLAAAMLREQFADTVVAGNLRVSALEALPRIGARTPVVLELSSWQLEGLGEAGLSPRYACVTNLSPDHLDRYGSMAAYGEAKKQIFLWQGPDGVVVLNHDDPIVAAWAAEAPGQVRWFGSYAGTRYDDAGIWQDGALLIARDEVPLPGRHNLANVAAAAALAGAFGAEAARIRAAVRGFGGVEHRLELVRELAGVRYVNDTAATAPEAAIAALHSFSQPIVLIAGGADKNLPFEGFARAIAESAKAVVLLEGSATPKLQSALAAAAPATPLLGPYGDFAAAIAAARGQAAPGEIVLLAPGCASFGMFRNEFHRGEEFRRIVGQL